MLAISNEKMNFQIAGNNPNEIRARYIQKTKHC